MNGNPEFDPLSDASNQNPATTSFGLMEPDPEVLERLRSAPAKTLSDAFATERDRLWQLVRFRMHHRLAQRVDPDDILQESFLAAEKRVEHYLKAPKCSLFVWLRMIVTQTLVDSHRRHLGAEMRSAGREISLGGPRFPSTTSASLAGQIAGDQTSPSGEVMRQEASADLERAIAEMPDLDQEVIALRHFEGLTNTETSEVLGISVTAASNRYVRALSRLRDILEAWDRERARQR
ncbi:MAG: sigma-70 family RNA polymerase sigma factor [Planctomycetota bacterium]